MACYNLQKTEQATTKPTFERIPDLPVGSRGENMVKLNRDKKVRGRAIEE